MTFQTFVMNGKLYGVIAATTPTGSYRRIESRPSSPELLATAAARCAPTRGARRPCGGISCALCSRHADLRDLRDRARAPGLGDDRLDEQVTARFERIGHAAEHGRRARRSSAAATGRRRTRDARRRSRRRPARADADSTSAERLFGRRVVDGERARRRRGTNAPSM